MNRPVCIAIAILNALALAAPAGAKLKEASMRLPAELAAAERLPVEGRQGWKTIERVRFGTFDIYDVRRSLTKGSDLRIAHVVAYELSPPAHPAMAGRSISPRRLTAL